MRSIERELEQRLKQDAQQFNLNAPSVEDAEKVRAVRMGMQQPAYSNKVFLRRSWMQPSITRIGWIAAVLCILLIVLPIWNPVNEQPAVPASTDAVHSDWGTLESYRSFAGDSLEQTIDSAISQHRIQMVNQTVTQQDLQLTLSAVTADRYNLIYFYTIKSLGDQNIVGLHDVRFTDENNPSVVLEDAVPYGDRVQASPILFKGVGRVALESDQPFPSHLTAEFNIVTANREIDETIRVPMDSIDAHVHPPIQFSFLLAPQFANEQPEVIKQDAIFFWEEGEARVERLVLMPLVNQMVVVLDMSSVAAGRTQPQPPSLYLLYGKGEQAVRLELLARSFSEIGTNRYMINYEWNNLLDSTKPLRLVVENNPNGMPQQIIDLHL